MAKEAKARIKINKLLEDSGWILDDPDSSKINVILEHNVKIPITDDDFESTENGFADYLLLDKNGHPFVVLEAKSETKDPLAGKEQARKYATNLNVRYVILSNGNSSYFWDMKLGNPSLITAFPSLDSLLTQNKFEPEPKNLIIEKVTENYIALTQLAEYANSSNWKDETKREKFIADNGLKFLRPYQVSAIEALQKSALNGASRFLFEMATGTGKTLVAAAIIKLFLKTGNAKRVLFLVDRVELEEQANRSFVKLLKNDFTTAIWKQNKDDWRKAEIVVTTIQSLTSNNRYLKSFSPTDFDFVISDEAHRSINGNARAVFEYFVGFKLGLTATPKDYLKNAEKIQNDDQRAWERRQLLDTYVTFGCDSGVPTYRYSLVDGVKDGYLINPYVVDARTEITTELLSKEGYAVKNVNENGIEEESVFYDTDFEKKFFSEKTNRSFCELFITNALKDPISQEIGKTIIFCVSQKHASRITQILNEMAMAVYPAKYNSDFALQVTSSIPDRQSFTVNFANNNLNGTTNFLEGYKSSKTRVCVTVGMMTTGYDCEDIQNLVFMRPIFSPSDFIQFKGRGTRKFEFKYATQQGDLVTHQKNIFKLFDFFGNCDYFENEFDYDEVLTLPNPDSGVQIPGGTPNPKLETSIFQNDPILSINEFSVASDGMKVDRRLFETFARDLIVDSQAQILYQNGRIMELEDYIKTNLFDKPSEYVSLDKLRAAVTADRRISLREFIEAIFSGSSNFASKDSLIEQEIAKFVAIYKPLPEVMRSVIDYFRAYLTDFEIRDIIETKEYSRLAVNPKLSLTDLKSIGQFKELIPNYVKDYVNLNVFV
jgi:type I restriction enzyme R subunit